MFSTLAIVSLLEIQIELFLDIRTLLQQFNDYLIEIEYNLEIAKRRLENYHDMTGAMNCINNALTLVKRIKDMEG